jgi:hypothetical protein
LSFNNTLRKANNKVFDQVNSQSEYIVRTGLSHGWLSHGLKLSYAKIYDHYPAYHHVGDVNNNKYGGGYYLNLALTDSLSINSEFNLAYNSLDDPNIRKEDFKNKGFDTEIVGNWGFNLLNSNFHSKIVYENENKTNNYNNKLNYSLHQVYESDNILLMTDANYVTSQSDIYTLVGANYEQTNSLTLDDINLRSIMQASYFDRLYLRTLASYNKSNSRYEASQNKNSKNEGYDFEVKSELIATSWLNLIWDVSYGDIQKEFYSSSNNRDIEKIKTVFGARFSTSFIDSLTIDQTLEKVSSIYPQAESGPDNDLISKVTKLSIRKNIGDNVNLKNYFTYSNWEEVNLAASLSGNNNIRTSYNYNPQLDILFGDKLLFTQNYTIRIDYDDFIYDSFNYNYGTITLYDRFYRQVSAEFKLRYNDSPYISLREASEWNKPNNLRIKRNNNDIILSYKYFANETGDRQNDIYEITGRNKKNELYIQAKKNLGNFSIQLKPKTEWGQTETYEVTATIEYLENDSTSFLLRAKPKYYVDNKETVYTVDCEVRLRF